MTARAWALMSKPSSERQYGGNVGYADEHRVLYRYDSTVANHRQLAAGDFVFLRGSQGAFGVAIIESIAASDGAKVLQRCPECGTTGIKARKHVTPVWRCNNRHVFSAPTAESMQVKLYVARFERTYLDLGQPIPAAAMKSAALRRSDQLSIEEVSLGKLEAAVLEVCPKAQVLVERFARLLDPEPEHGNEDSEVAFTGSQTDGRAAVIRSILARRGQARFRSLLIDRYGPKCMITGCELLDLLEGAHIKPYRGDEDNSAQNGLLLRADIHTMFDLYLLGINPTTLTIRLHPKVMKSDYAHLDGKQLGLSSSKRPATTPLEARWLEFLTRLGEETPIGKLSPGP